MSLGGVLIFRYVGGEGLAVGDLLRKYGVLVMGLVIGGGFAFGGIASYAGLTNTDGGGGGDGRTVNSTRPSAGFADGSFERGVREQLLTAARHRVVLVNAYYNSSEQRQELQGLSVLPDRFDGRVYVRTVNESEAGEAFFTYSPERFPAVVVFGANRNYRSQPVYSTEAGVVSDEICSAFASVEDFAAQCTV